MKIKIVGIELLAEAINNLANAIKGNASSLATLESVVETIKPSPPVEAPVNVVNIVTPPVEVVAPQLSAAERKVQIIAEIEALGGKAPDRGTVAKFEEALVETKLKASVELEEEEPEMTVTINHDTVRAFAGAMVKSNPEMGRTKLGAILKKVGAESITLATEKQLLEIVPLLEKAAGKAFA